MTKAKMKRKAYAHAALMIDSNLASMDPPGDWEDEPMNDADEDRWYQSMYEIRNFLAAKGGIEFKDERGK